MQPDRPPLLLSLVAPARDEAGSLAGLHARVVEVLGNRRTWELIVVDDGSRDGTAGVLRELEQKDPRVRGVVLGEPRGQSAALLAGIEFARAPLIATLDADLQNDPADLIAMQEAMDGADAVVGYRSARCDSMSRRISSRVANALRNRISGDRIRDSGCSLKLFRAQAILGIPWFDGAHRFLPTLLRIHGFTVVEHPVAHRPRYAGRSKYGIRNRAWRGFVDLLAVRWLSGRAIPRTHRRSSAPADGVD